MLVNRAALDRYAVPNGGDGLVESRRAIDDEECGPPQPALDEVVEDSAPSLGALYSSGVGRLVELQVSGEDLALRLALRSVDAGRGPGRG
jgi:hypothetical protein